MAVVAVNLTPKTYAEIMALVSSGIYGSLEQFVEIALFNQFALEKGAKPEQLIEAHSLERRPQLRPDDSNIGEERPGKTALQPRPVKQAVSRQRGSSYAVDPGELEQALNQLSLTQLVSANLPPVAETSAISKERIWGQVNRLLPLKLTCRWLAVIAAKKKAWPALRVIAEPLANDAAVIGSALEKDDEAKGRKREEILATGLPRKGNLQSRDRFLSQFVARVTRAGSIYPGAISHYRLAQFDEERLVLTSAGKKLAELENPVLDGALASVSETLSTKERSFFLSQIQAYALVEWNEFKALMAAIAAGNVTPDSLLKSLRSSFPPEWTDVAFRTHIYGLLARVSDLDLLGKEWDGRRVQYKLTKAAAAVLAT